MAGPDEPRAATSRGLPAWVGLYAVFLTIACAALCVLVLRLRAMNAELREQAERMVARAASEFLPVGGSFPALKLLWQREGQEVGGTGSAVDPLAFGDGRAGSMVVFISKSCPHCEHEMPYFQSLAAGLTRRGIVCAAIEVDAMMHAAIHHASTPELPVVAAERPEATWLRKIPMVPGIAIIAPDGTVRHSAFGTLDDSGRAAIEAAARVLAP